MQVQVEILQIESDDVANELTEYVAKGNITKLVIGTSSRGLLSRYLYFSFFLSDHYCSIWGLID